MPISPSSSQLAVSVFGNCLGKYGQSVDVVHGEALAACVDQTIFFQPV
ncbi:MAG: hypothetical protein HOH56_00940 [Acidiferrobacteraceae bacterium]|nr:hypothetical protein [Acidiferrobacteraceae bacterium]